MAARQTITEEYRREQQELHRNPHYGVASLGFAGVVKRLVEETGARSICDYGAGKCNLKRKLDEIGLAGVAYFPCDPAFPEYGPPRRADLVCCIDVLEHIEPDYLENVLMDLRDAMGACGLLTIHTGPALKTLPDGRNAHLIQKPRSWWLPRLSRHFEVMHLENSTGGFWVVVTPGSEAVDPPSPESA